MFIHPSQLWNVKDGSLLKICSREGKDGMDSLHGGWVTDLHFSPDDSLLVSTGGYIKVCLHADIQTRAITFFNVLYNNSKEVLYLTHWKAASLCLVLILGTQSRPVPDDLMGFVMYKII